MCKMPSGSISPGIICHTVTSEIAFGDLTSDLYFDLYPVPTIQRLLTQLNMTSFKQICEIPLLEQCISSTSRINRTDI